MPFGSVKNAAFPLMCRVFRAFPPHFPAVIREDVARSEETVACVVPLGCDVGKERSERVGGVDGGISTEGTGVVRAIAILRRH